MTKKVWVKRDASVVDPTEICAVCTTTLSDKVVWDLADQNSPQNSPEFSTCRVCGDCQQQMTGLERIDCGDIALAFSYLDMIRATAKVNMMASASLLSTEFNRDYDTDLTRNEARQIAKLWMTTFGVRRTDV